MSFKPKLEHTQPLFSALKLLKFEHIYNVFVSRTAFKYINNDNLDIFQKFEHSHGTRGNNINLIGPQHNTTLFENSILSTVPKIWNNLPFEIKKVNTLETLKLKLKKHFFLQQNS